MADAFLANFLRNVDAGEVQSIMDVYRVALFYDSGLLDWGRLVEPDDFRGLLVDEFLRSIGGGPSGVIGGGVMLWLKNISFGVDEVLDAVRDIYVNRLDKDVSSLAYLYHGVVGNDYVCVRLRVVVCLLGVVDEFISILNSRYAVDLSGGRFFDGLPGEFQLGVML